MADISLPNIAPQYPGQTSLVDVMRGYTDAARGNLALQTERATQPAEIQRANANAAAAQTAAWKSRYSFDQSQQQQAAQFASTLAQDPELIAATKQLNEAKDARVKAQSIGPVTPDNDPYEQAASNVSNLFATKIAKVRGDMVAAGLPLDKVEANAAHLSVLATQHPELVLPTVDAALRSYLSPEAQNAVQKPAPVLVNTGTAIVPTQVGSEGNTGVKSGGQVGPAVPLTVSPENRTGTVAAPDGTQWEFTRGDDGNILPGSYRPLGTPANGPPVAPPTKATAQVAVQSAENQQAHFTNVQKDASTARDASTALQEARANVDTSSAGKSDWRRVLNAYAAQFGIPNDASVADDVLAKNLARVALNTGDTDLARTMSQASNPSVYNTKGGLRILIPEMIGVQEKKLAAENYFNKFQPGTPGYDKARQVWNTNADSRIFVMNGMPKTDAITYLKQIQKNNPEDAKKIIDGAAALHAAGVF